MANVSEPDNVKMPVVPFHDPVMFVVSAKAKTSSPDVKFVVILMVALAKLAESISATVMPASTT